MIVIDMLILAQSKANKQTKMKTKKKKKGEKEAWSE